TLADQVDRTVEPFLASDLALEMEEVLLRARLMVGHPGGQPDTLGAPIEEGEMAVEEPSLHRQLVEDEELVDVEQNILAVARIGHHRVFDDDLALTVVSGGGVA